MNRLLRFYHSGATEDLDAVVHHAIEKGYKEINLIGFSLGGNLTLKYLGEDRRIDKAIQKAAVFSVPLDLHASCVQISKPGNFIYSNRFLRHLKKKIRTKAEALPNELSVTGLSDLKTLMHFDDHYTAPIHGYDNAKHYYESCSSIRFVDSIAIPTLIVNALNDPFLPKECYPVEKLKKHKKVTLHVPKRGGHVGFAEFNEDKVYWSEKRALDFINS